MNKKQLENLYVDELMSVSDIADKLEVSQGKINYWFKKFDIPKRSISQAIYIKCNPEGDPFRFNPPQNQYDWFLFGAGIGLYWGEGNKKNKSSLRLGNTDPNLLNLYILFLERIFSVDKSKLKFGLQIFSDVSPTVAKKFWVEKLEVLPNQFQKIILTPSSKKGTYKEKSRYGVLTIYFNNTKLKRIFDSTIESLSLV